MAARITPTGTGMVMVMPAGPGVIGRLGHVLRPHSHDATGKVDAAMEASAEGIRALWISLAVLGGTALLQAAVVAISGSVALLGDTLHNAADAPRRCRSRRASSRPRRAWSCIGAAGRTARRSCAS